MIREHLNQLFSGRSFIIEEQKLREGASSKSFKIGGDLDLKDALYDGNNWPIGVTIRRFTFFDESKLTPKKVSNVEFDNIANINVQSLTKKKLMKSKN